MVCRGGPGKVPDSGLVIDSVMRTARVWFTLQNSTREQPRGKRKSELLGMLLLLLIQILILD